MTAPLTAEQRADLTEHMWPALARLVCLVHGDGGQRDIQQHIARLSPDEKTALLVMLAALVDPDDRPADLLHWITWDEHGRPAPPTTDTPDRRTLRAINPTDRWWVSAGTDDLLAHETVLRARRLHVGEHHSLNETARIVGVDARTVLRWKQAGWKTHAA